MREQLTVKRALASVPSASFTNTTKHTSSPSRQWSALFRLCISLLHAFSPPLNAVSLFLPHSWPNRPQSNNRNLIPIVNSSCPCPCRQQQLPVRPLSHTHLTPVRDKARPSPRSPLHPGELGRCPQPTINLLLGSKQ